MKRANNQSTTCPQSASPTRRGVLTAIAGASLVAIPVAAAAATGSRQGASFTTLGARLQEQWAVCASNRPAYEEAHDKANELIYQGLTQAPRELDINEDSDKSEYWAVVSRAHEATGFDKAEKVSDDAMSAIHDTILQIESLTPATIGDLAVLANVCAYTNPDLWDCPVEELDWEVRHFRVLVDTIVKLAGAKSILEGLPIPQTVDQSAHQRAREFWDRKEGRPTETRKIAIFKALVDARDEIGSPHGVAPEVFRERALAATNSRLACTEQELEAVVDWVEPRLKAATKSIAPAGCV
jgi:hypothetical protein